MTRILRSAAVALLLAAAVVPTAAAGDSGDGGWYVVRYPHRITSADRAALDATGADAVQYLPSSSYAAWMEPGALAAARALGLAPSPMAASAKIDPSMAGRGPVVLASLLVHRDAIQGTLAALKGLGYVRAQQAALPGGAVQRVVLLAAASALPRIAVLPGVQHVGSASPGLEAEDEASAQIQAGNINASKLPVLGYEAWLTSVGLNGSGVRVSIADTGVDESHPDLQGRVVAKVDYGDVGGGLGEPEDFGGHGTHVAGITGGTGATLPGIGRVKDAGGFLYGLGIAPAVSFVDQNVIGNFSEGGWPPSYGWDRISRDAVRNGSVAWNSSWNSLEGTNVGYIESARTLDVMVRDADWLVSGAEPITMVFSAGNGGGTTSTITAPKEAKNIITVGSSRSSRVAGGIDTLSTFTSKGPARDGRILPTISAPGESILSSRSRAPAGSCNTPDTGGFGFYSLCSGTSMAAPHVTGAVALITQWWRRDHAGATPSPAMVKALLINSATDMGTADIPNKNEGWGRVNLKQLFDASTQRINADQNTVLTELGQLSSLSVEAVDPSLPLRVSLVWTDAAGAAGASPALVNDLDLRVTAADGTVYFGNRFSGGKSVTGGAPDRRNNLENVFLATPAGTYTIDVEAFNLPGDGVPFAGDETDQDYALVVSNVKLV